MLYRVGEADTRQSGSDVLTHGLGFSPLACALRAIRPADPIKCIHHNSNSPCKAISYRYHQIPTGITIKYNKFCLKYRFVSGFGTNPI